MSPACVIFFFSMAAAASCSCCARRRLLFSLGTINGLVLTLIRLVYSLLPFSSSFSSSSSSALAFSASFYLFILFSASDFLVSSYFLLQLTLSELNFQALYELIIILQRESALNYLFDSSRYPSATGYPHCASLASWNSIVAPWLLLSSLARLIIIGSMKICPSIRELVDILVPMPAVFIQSDCARERGYQCFHAE